MARTALIRPNWIESILNRYERPLLRYAFQITADIEIARDVVQDTFLRLCRADRTKIEGHLVAWLFTVCRNRALDVMKKERRMEHSPNQEIHLPQNRGPVEISAQNETLKIIEEVLASLNENQQTAFRLKFGDQLTYREISQVMGKSLGSVSRFISTALCAVRDRLYVESIIEKEDRP